YAILAPQSLGPSSPEPFMVGAVVAPIITYYYSFTMTGGLFPAQKGQKSSLHSKKNSFQLETSLIRSAKVLERLCLVQALTTLYLVSQGTEVVKQGQRRWVDPHWFRGQNYLKIGWKWVERALSRGYELVTRLHLSAGADPEPAIASRRQAQKPPRLFIALEFHEAVA